MRFGADVRSRGKFNPRALRNVSFVFAPEEGISLATGVGQWTPRPGAFALGQASGGAQPAYGRVSGLANRHALTFDGSNDTLTNTTPEAAYDWALGFYIAAVILPTTLSGATRPAVGTGTASGAGTMWAGLTSGGAGTVTLFDSGGTGRTATTGDTISSNTPALVECRYYGSTLGARLNGGTEVTETVASPPSTARGIAAGSDGGSRDFNGAIALLVICQGVSADPANVRELRRWVKSYYNIQAIAA
jgi:hypothetical protein